MGQELALRERRFTPLKIRAVAADGNDVNSVNHCSAAGYAALLNAPNSSNQGCRRFHLGQSWATKPSLLVSISRKYKKRSFAARTVCFSSWVVTNAVIARDHDPSLRSCLREPHDVLGGRKELVVHTDVDPSAKRFRNLPTPE